MKPRRWGFRARLAALIASVFILGGTVLLIVQYLLVRQLFERGIDTILIGCVAELPDDGSLGLPGGGTTIDVPQLCPPGIPTSGGVAATAIAMEQTTTSLSQGVMSGLLIGSVIVLVAFAALAVLAAWWLSKRSLGRIARITDTTREITRDDLHRRLALAGPDDEIKELGDTIDGMLDRIEDAFTRQERFIAGASHELRTPLTATRTLLEIPLEQGRVPVELEPEVRGALAANQRSEQLIAALLTLARSSRRISQAEPVDRAEPVDLTELAASVLDERGDEVRVLAIARPAPHPVLAVADRDLSRIAVANLVDNAIRHNIADGCVQVRTGGDEDTTWVEMENSGRDLAGADLGMLTEPFHRGDQTRLTTDEQSGPGQGLGLGLALVETVARSQGGALTLSARVGGGLVARLTLPAYRR